MMKKVACWAIQWLLMPVVVVLYWIPFILAELVASVAFWLDNQTVRLGSDGIFRYKRYGEDEWRVLVEDHPTADTINGAGEPKASTPPQGTGGRNGPGSAGRMGQ